MIRYIADCTLKSLIGSITLIACLETLQAIIILNERRKQCR